MAKWIRHTSLTEIWRGGYQSTEMLF